jgi:hypothetical protein
MPARQVAELVEREQMAELVQGEPAAGVGTPVTAA